MSFADEAVGDHEQGQVADGLAAGRDLDDVAQQLVRLGIRPADFLPAIGQAQGPRLLIEVRVLPARHLVAVQLGRRRQQVAVERQVELADGLPVVGDRRELAGRPGRVSRLVNRRASTIAFRFGWLVPPDIAAIAPSAMSSFSSAASRIDAACMPAVSCVWKWIGMPISCLSVLTSSSAAYGLHRPAMSLMARMCAPSFSSSLASST